MNRISNGSFWNKPQIWNKPLWMENDDREGHNPRSAAEDPSTPTDTVQFKHNTTTNNNNNNNNDVHRNSSEDALKMQQIAPHPNVGALSSLNRITQVFGPTVNLYPVDNYTFGTKVCLKKENFVVWKTNCWKIMMFELIIDLKLWRDSKFLSLLFSKRMYRYFLFKLKANQKIRNDINF